jgi:catechol 2,3-dioxygenase-like lactoylglutathione lyase family enzyme
MIDHVILNVKNLNPSRKFYEAALAPLGYEAVMAYEEGVGFGVAG